MSEWNGDPLHERDLPHAELMLARILRDAEHDHVVVEELDDLDAEPRGRRWLYAVAAAVMVIALASIGWVVSRPDSRSTQPAQQPTVVASSTPAPSPSIEATLPHSPAIASRFSAQPGEDRPRAERAIMWTSSSPCVPAAEARRSSRPWWGTRSIRA